MRTHTHTHTHTNKYKHKYMRFCSWINEAHFTLPPIDPTNHNTTENNSQNYNSTKCLNFACYISYDLSQ